MLHKNGTKVCPISPIMTLQEHIWDKRERFRNNTTISIIHFFA